MMPSQATPVRSLFFPALFAVLVAITGCAVFTGRAAAQELPLPPTAADGAELTEVFSGEGFYEGPMWDPATGKLYFTGFYNNNAVLRIHRLDASGSASVWADETQGINGTFLSNEGRMLGAQGMGKAVIDWKIGADGPLDQKTLYQNDELNQPNDICQTADGRIYFTDPNFQTNVSGVYLVKDGTATKIIDDIAAPNGIMTSPDGKTLYVSDSGGRQWQSYPLNQDGTPGEGKVFFGPESNSPYVPDGMTIDADGNLYFAGLGGVWMVSPAGEAQGFVPVPEFCSNAAFGGPDGKTLYMTCAGKVYSLEMTVTGAKR